VSASSLVTKKPGRESRPGFFAWITRCESGSFGVSGSVGGIHACIGLFVARTAFTRCGRATFTRCGRAAFTSCGCATFAS
jgi:hypothetical protein